MLLLDIELREDGGSRLFVGRGTLEYGQTPAEHNLFILDGIAVAYARRLVDRAVAIGERADRRGSWMLGVHCDRLRGRDAAPSPT